MGGAVVQWLAIEHRPRIGALVMGCSRPGASHFVPASDRVIAAMRDPNVDARTRLLNELL
jgi:3-oxoadipate enol-lactonase